MSSSEDPFTAVRNRVLLHIAKRLGPEIDVVDFTYHDELFVRDVVLELGKENGPSPSEVRAAMLDLIAAGHLHPRGLDPTKMLRENTAGIQLTDRGLVAARRLEPGCGRPVRIIVLRTRRKRHLLHVHIDSGDKERDTKLNKSGMVRALLFVVLIQEPTKDRPLVVDQCDVYLDRLAVHGIERRSGPTGAEGRNPDTVRKALKLLASILPLKCELFGEDERRDFFFLDGPLPEIRVEAGDRRHVPDWSSFRHILFRIVEGQSLGHIVGVQQILDPYAELEENRVVGSRAPDSAKPGTEPAPNPAPAPATTQSHIKGQEPEAEGPRSKGSGARAAKKKLPKIEFMDPERLERSTRSTNGDGTEEPDFDMEAAE